MIDETLRQLIEFVKEASPIIWEAVYKQVYVEAVSYSVWFVFLLVSTYVCYRAFLFSKNETEKNRWSDWGVVQPIAIIIGVVTILFAVFCFNSAIGRFVNPEFYAIRYLLSQIG